MGLSVFSLCPNNFRTFVAMNFCKWWSFFISSNRWTWNICLFCKKHGWVQWFYACKQFIVFLSQNTRMSGRPNVSGIILVTQAVLLYACFISLTSHRSDVIKFWAKTLVLDWISILTRFLHKSTWDLTTLG